MAEKENSKSENTETKKNEQIREYGQTKLEHNIHLLSVIGEMKDTNAFPPIQKLQSTSTSFLSLLPLRTAVISRDCSFF